MPSRLAKARAHLRKALALQQKAERAVEGASSDKRRERRRHAMLQALAQARFLQAELEYQRVLQLEFPRDLDFSARAGQRRQRSLRAFARYLENTGKMLERARVMYQAVVRLRVPHWAVAAAARIGQLFQNFANALYTAPVPKPRIPRELRTSQLREDFVEAFTDAYCDGLEERANPLQDKAVEALTACLNLSTELSCHNEWSKLCERELYRISPTQYPIASEIRPEPGYLTLRTVRASVFKTDQR